MDSLEPLNTVLEHARSERDVAQAAMRQADAAHAAARAQAEQLDSYRADYRQRWTERLRGVNSVELLQCYQGFSGRLDQAITMQSHSVRQAEVRLQRAREMLLAKEQRVAAIGKLIERRAAEARLHADRREQRQLDEAAARMSSSRRNVFPVS